ncbi:MAG: serine O-acetyltransferase [Rubrivivax sp.]|nr:serine O-acetyltransferase [Rubrivivax sp.]
MFALRIHRAAHWLHCRSVPLLPWLLKSLNRIVFATVLPPSARIGAGVILSYEGLGTVIHRRAVIEDEVVIGAGVTIGGRSGHVAVPHICRGAMIGAGAKVLGPVRIGEYASIGANAVVLEDVPDHAVAVGVPARVVRINLPGERPDYREFR